MSSKMMPLACVYTREQIARFEQIRDALSRKTPGARTTRSDVIRMLAERALPGLERELGLRGEAPEGRKL